MNRSSLLPVCLICYVAISTIGCSSLPFVGSAKSKEPAKQAEVSHAEWGPRTWEMYAKDRNGITNYVDKIAITYPSKGVIHVWRRKVFPEKEGIRSSHKEIITYDEVNCEAGKYRSLETQLVNWDGTTTDIFRKPTPWTTVFEATVDDLLLHDYCKTADKAGQQGPLVPGQ